MAIIKMEKLAVIGVDAAKEDLIADLMDLGMVEITDRNVMLSENENLSDAVTCDGDEDKVAEIDGKIAKLGIALDLINRYSREKQPLFVTRKSMKRAAFLDRISNRSVIEANVKYILGLNRKLHDGRERINKIKMEIAFLIPWQKYDLPLEIQETEQVDIELGVVPSTVNIEGIREAVTTASDSAEVRVVNRDKDMYYLFIAALKEEQEKVVSVLKQWGYTPAPFDDYAGTAKENKRRLEKESITAWKSFKDIEEQVSACEYMRVDIECLKDYLVIERDREKVKSNFLKTKRTFNLEGWIPSECKGTVEKVLNQYDCMYEYREASEEEEVPVLIKNTGFGSPFSAITEMYSLPDYHGFDPTDIFSVFYAMFFGIMLSDAGYGLIIAIASFIVLKRYEIEGLTYKMIKMFMYCGIATVFWGAMFGGWFGDFIPTFTQTVFGHRVNISPIWFNPIDNPTKLLIFSLLFGVGHLFVGMGINAYMLIRRGKAVDAFLDIFSWYMIIAGGGLWLGGSAVSEELTVPGKWICIAGGIIVLLAGGRKNKGFGKVTGGLGSLYGVTGYISDILSYARLLALGLATGVIANVINLLGSMVGGGIKGLIAMLIVGIIGHTFNLAINALGSFVHSSRLQYIEFFGKFYEDGGEEFSPLRNNTQYVRLIDNNNGGLK